MSAYFYRVKTVIRHINMYLRVMLMSVLLLRY